MQTAHQRLEEMTDEACDTLRYGYEGELKKAIDIADFYGFSLSCPLTVSKEHREHERKHRCPAHYVSALQTFLTNDVHAGNAVRVAHTRRVPYKKDLELHLEIIGDAESSAEGLLFQTLQAILREYGYRAPTVAINSIGRHEAVHAYAQALTNYFQPRLGELETSCRESFKESVFSPMQCSHQRCAEVRREAPQSLNYLSEPGRTHFKEVLEYLESLDIPYTIEPTLLGSEHYTTKTVFSFRDERDAEAEAPHEPLIFGERYDRLSRRLGYRKNIPALHAVLTLPLRSAKEKIVTLKRPAKKAPIYLIQVGLQAKIQTLLVGESLRKAHVRIETALHHNSVGTQMEYAKRAGAPLLVIIGQREVYEGTALVRHITTNQQDSVPLSQLPLYLKTRVRQV